MLYKYAPPQRAPRKVQGKNPFRRKFVQKIGFDPSKRPVLSILPVEKVQVGVSTQVPSVSVKVMIDSGALGVFQKAILYWPENDLLPRRLF